MIEGTFIKGIISTISFIAFAIQPATTTVLNEAVIDSASTTSKTEIRGVLDEVFPNRAEREIMERVAYCESRLFHDIKGKVVKGKINDKDTGLFQINDTFHGKQAAVLGHDIRTLEGNARYAKYLFDRNGLSDWASSSRCWKSYFSGRVYK